MPTREQVRNPRWRLSNLYYIGTPDGEKVLFIPNAAQQNFIDNQTGVDIILKARQLGFTTLACLIALDEVLFNKNHNAAIIAHTRDAAVRIFEDKVKFPYSNLPQWLQDERPATTDKAGMLSFEHGCSICVTTSPRSMSLQRLHISEFGKICSKHPEKAREIITGAIPAVGKNPITIESTAEGQEGYFYNYCTDAMANRGVFKLHFYPWYADANNSLEETNIPVTVEHNRYFDDLKTTYKIALTEGQKRWWVDKEYILAGDMKRENPATPKEAFEQALEGAYFSDQLMWLDKHDCIGKFPCDPAHPVQTFWDLGINDMTTIWFMQYINSRYRFVHYYESSGEAISHYVNYVADWLKNNNLSKGDYYWPHDGSRKDLFLPDGRLGVADELGIRPVIVPRTSNKMNDIETARKVLPQCEFDNTQCATGLKRLRHYRKVWDDSKSVFHNAPLHDVNSHGADAFMVFARCSKDFGRPKVDQKILDDFDASWTAA